MLYCFTLSMPSNNAWDGHWSGEDKIYAKIVHLETKPKSTYYCYAFGDNWVAGITVTPVNSTTARLIRKKSIGFCGYDWMVDSIIQHGKITTEVNNGN